MKVYTKTGDKGTTALVNGKRVPKSHIRLEAYGTTDELNSYIGLIRDLTTDEERRALFLDIQDRLFTIGSHLASEGDSRIVLPALHESDIEQLEQAIDKMQETVPPMRSFVLPGGHQTSSYCHIARCVCRRAERNAIRVTEESEVPELVIKYLNRLSDYLFVLARMVIYEQKLEEIPWVPKK
ncbi:cob(I)yrinic acid a,c-diamide adenosyltransferase [Persicobacter sp. CCB-QB2]|uniref:cob(I)yrinic acid a,c-diamide adenosyltransferase n=1 Tax=Persicobacter sp. CCB-QB2 TaxID=1561025 RepID=UPI0006A99EBB|nr:cob(I)yrinic acid a,c-diamide adenosyltransferase [Persicobacter sp. CCB-QB2]